MRTYDRRFTRLTNAFSKKAENHAYMVALYTTWYNFVRKHKTLRVAPAMAAGISPTPSLARMAEAPFQNSETMVAVTNMQSPNETSA